jgi:hypothetical protein
MGGSVSIVSGYGIDGCGNGFLFPLGAGESTAQCPDRLGSTHGLLPNGYLQLFTRGKAAGA